MRQQDPASRVTPRLAGLYTALNAAPWTFVGSNLPPLLEPELRQLVDTLPVGVLVQDATPRILYVNRRALELLGMTADQLLGHSILDPFWSVVRSDGSVFPQDEFPAMQALRTGREVHDVVMGVRHNSQTERVWILVRAEPAFDGAGTVTRVIVTFTDITALRAAELARASAVIDAERFRSALDEVPAYVYIKDRASRYQYANALTLRLFNVSAEELRGSGDERFFPPDVVARLRAVDLRVLAGERTHETITVRTPNGERIYLEVKSPLAPDTETGEVPGLLGISIDITERRHLEDVYRQSQRLEAIGRLAGGVAHDFNNMLGVILGHAELALAAAPEGSVQRESLDEIFAAARRSADLTRQLLAFSRKQPSAPVPVQVGAHALGTLKLLRRLVGEDIALSVHPECDDWLAHLDPTQLDQVLANLCVNASDAIRSARAARGAAPHADSIRIETSHAILSASRAQEQGVLPGEYLRLSVRDTGPGVPPDVRERMFEPFFTTKPQGEGTGLGLATVFGIVSQARGFIDVESTLGAGAAFHLYFPRLVDGAPAPSTGQSVGATSGGGETIFVVEDEPAVLQLAVRALSALGYRVFSATDGASALQIAQAHAGPIDLLLTDLIMPGMNGRELAETLQDRRPGLRVLFMSGYSADILRSDGEAFDDSRLLAKPFSIQELALRIRAALSA